MIRPPPRSTLFPCTTLFRSLGHGGALHVVLQQSRHRPVRRGGDRKSTRLNSSHTVISYAVFCLKKKKASIVNAQEVAVTEQDPAQPVNEAPACGCAVEENVC